MQKLLGTSNTVLCQRLQRNPLFIRPGEEGYERFAAPASAGPEPAQSTRARRDSTRTSAAQTVSEESPAWTTGEYLKMFNNYKTEEHYDIQDIEGQLPKDLEGTFYRNGPGITELGGHDMHCFDGHGLIARVTIKDGKASFKSRYVRTQVFKEEMEADKVLYRGFGSQKPGGLLNNAFDIRDKPVANTSILEWGGRLYALWEAHNPYILDPATLETLGEETFDKSIPEEQPFTAHPCYDRHTDRLVAYSNAIRHGEGKLHIWEIDSEKNIKKSITHAVGLLPVLYLHDFQVTKNWYIFHQAPLNVNAANAMLYFAGACNQTQQIEFDDESPGKWWLVPRDGGSPQLVDTEPLMIWHYGNAYEDPSTGKVYVDACAMDHFSFADFDMRDPKTLPVSEVTRFEIDVERSSSKRTTLLPHSSDFPQLNPAYQGIPDYRFLYTAGSLDEHAAYPFRWVIKLDVETKEKQTWLAPPGSFVGEPIYAERKTSSHRNGSNGSSLSESPAEDDGYVIVLESDTRKEKSRLLVFHAADIQSGPICKINLKKLLPMAFHCAWSSTAFQ